MLFVVTASKTGCNPPGFVKPDGSISMYIVPAKRFTKEEAIQLVADLLDLGYESAGFRICPDWKRNNMTPEEIADENSRLDRTRRMGTPTASDVRI